MRRSGFLAAILLAAVCAQSAPGAEAPSHSRTIRIGPEPGWTAKLMAEASKLDKAGGGLLLLDSGTFLFGTGDTLLFSGLRNLWIRGAGSSTRFQTAPRQTPPRFFLKFRNCFQARVQDIFMAGTPLPPAFYQNNKDWHTGISTSGGDGIHVQGCRFSGFYTGAVHVNATRNASVTGCRFEAVDNKAGGDYGAVHLQELDGAVVADNEILNCRFSGISSWSAKRLLVQRNRITVIPSAPYGMGLYLIGGLQNSMLADNRIERPANEGIMIHGKKGQPVIGNVVSGNIITAAYAGIVFNDATADVGETRANAVLDNEISGIPGDPVDLGILLHQNKHTTVSGNKIRHSISGIALQNSARENTVSGNTIVRCKAGIVAGGETLIEDNRIDSASEYAVIVSRTSRTMIRRNTVGTAPKALIWGDNIQPGAIFLDGNTGMDSAGGR